MRIAIILPGELRFESLNHFNNFYEKVKDYDIYISTYAKYEKLCKKLNAYYLIVDENKTYEEKFDFVNIKSKNKNRIWQWYHLSNILKKYKNELSNYDCILKLRTDIIFSKPKITKVNKYTIYAASDLIFYAEAKHFIKVFENIFDNIKNIYYNNVSKYIPISYDNILNSNISLTNQTNGLRYNWLILPTLIHVNEHFFVSLFDENFYELKENIKKNYDFLKILNKIYSLNTNTNIIYSNIDNEILKKIKNVILTTYIHSFCLKDDWDFSSEQMMCLHVFNNSYAENLCFNIDQIDKNIKLEWLS